MAKPDFLEGKVILPYPRRHDLEKMATLQAYLQVAQAILAFDPDFPMYKVRAALGHAKSPDALSRALRHSMPCNHFGLGGKTR